MEIMEMFKDWFIRPAAIIMMVLAASSFLLLLYILFFLPQCPLCESRRVTKRKFLEDKWVEDNTSLYVPKQITTRITRITCLKCGNVSFKD